MIGYFRNSRRASEELKVGYKNISKILFINKHTNESQNVLNIINVGENSKNLQSQLNNN